MISCDFAWLVSSRISPNAFIRRLSTCWSSIHQGFLVIAICSSIQDNSYTETKASFVSITCLALKVISCTWSYWPSGLQLTIIFIIDSSAHHFFDLLINIWSIKCWKNSGKVQPLPGAQSDIFKYLIHSLAVQFQKKKIFPFMRQESRNVLFPPHYICMMNICIMCITFSFKSIYTPGSSALKLGTLF